MAHESDWETSSGLALDGATVAVSALEFGFNANMGAGITCANFTFVTDDGEEIEQSFSVGKNFEPNRDGSAIEGTGKINKNSNFGLLIESIKDVVESPGDIIGDPKVAAGWIGTKWAFSSIEREVRNPTTGETKMSTKFVVEEYLGSAADAKAAPAAAKGAKASTGKAAAAKTSGAGDVDEALWAELLELAGQHDDHEEFVNAALDLPAVEASKAAQKAVMGTKAGSVWAAKG